MSQMIQLDESNASRRVVYLWSVLSNGTSPAQFEAGGQPQVSVAGLAPWNSAGTLLAINSTNGEYAVNLGASDVSVLGPGIVRYSSSSALETSIPFQIIGYNPYGSLSTFDASTVSVGLKAQVHSGASVGVVDIAPAVGAISALSFVPAPGSHSAVTIGGVTRVNSSVTIADAEYSGVTVRASVLSGQTPQTGDNFARLGAPAGASVSADIAAVKVDTAAILVDTGTTLDGNITAIKAKTDQMVYTVANRLDATINSAVTLAAGTYSDVTIGGVTRVNSNVTIADADYSGVTVRASNITIATGGIVAASFGAGAIDAVALATDATEEMADTLLGRNIAGGSSGGRTVTTALYPLRNRVAIDGSIGTVYQVNDTTSAWTFSVATVSANSGFINQVDPGA